MATTAKPALTVVTGPPCAGKTTYVREHKQAGDIVIDFDDLASALGCTERHGYSERDHVWWVTLAARSAAITEAIERHRKGATVWIIDAKPTFQRQRQYRDARARMVRLNASREELHARASADGRPQAWHTRIDAWADNRYPDDPSPAHRTRW